MKPISVYLEIGKKRVLASAADWPGWCRGARDEAAALQALVEYGQRYASVLDGAGLSFQPPTSAAGLAVAERAEGNATTDFGAPAMIAEAERAPVSAQEMARLQKVLLACWDALERAARTAAGRDLRKGPRGGGRELEEILRHTLEANGEYLKKLGWKPERGSAQTVSEQLAHMRTMTQAALDASARGELPTQGPRGGAMWPPRYFVRRAAWHILDHAWEIEDRLEV